jgi:hypothetical protein
MSSEITRDLADKCSVVIAYEDHATHDRARALCDRLLNRFWGDVEFDLSWWNFDYIHEANLLQAAIEAAVKAQFVLISAHASPQLPAAVHNWIAQWTTARQQAAGAAGTLVALIGMEHERGTTPITVYLRQAARQAQMDFLPRLRVGATPKAEAPKSASHLRNNRVSIALNRMLDPRRPPSHWGLNE